MVTQSVARLVKATQEIGRKCGALVLTMVIADETDEAAMAKWEHYKAGADLEALAYRDAQAEDDPSRDPLAGPNKRRTLGTHNLPTTGRCAGRLLRHDRAHAGRTGRGAGRATASC